MNRHSNLLLIEMQVSIRKYYIALMGLGKIKKLYINVGKEVDNRGPTSLAMRGMQTKTTMRYHFTPPRVAIIKNAMRMWRN